MHGAHLMAVLLLVGASAQATEVVHVFVALADNASQGLVPVPRIGAARVHDAEPGLRPEQEIDRREHPRLDEAALEEQGVSQQHRRELDTGLDAIREIIALPRPDVVHHGTPLGALMPREDVGQDGVPLVFQRAPLFARQCCAH